MSQTYTTSSTINATKVAAVPPSQIQIANNAPIPPQLSVVTSPLVNAQQVLFRLRNFPSQTYTITTDSHIYRLMNALLGEAAGAQLRKRGLFNRLRETMAGTNFLDLDGFWGFIFGISRNQNELLSSNPYVDTNSIVGWQAQKVADASYRDRIFQFSRAVGYGPTQAGIKLVAEAILSCPVQITVHFNGDPLISNVPNGLQSYVTTLQPYQNITIAQQYDLKSILDQLKPANTIIQILTTGLDPYIQVNLSGAWADSSYWEVDFSVDSEGTVYTSDSKQTYAYGSYQGEYWSTNGFIAATLSYLLDINGDNILSYDDQLVNWSDGSATIFSSSQSILSPAQSVLGYLSEVGVTQSNPINPIASVSDLIVNSVPIADALTAIPTITPNAESDQYFWSSFPRLGSDASQDVVEIRLSEIHLVNSVSFQTANFPQFIQCQYFDTTNGLWVTAYSQNVNTAVPLVIPSPLTALENHTHPQHFGPGHWLQIAFRISPTSLNRIRIIMSRIDGAGPYAINGDSLAYCMGLKDFNAQYIVDSVAALPIGTDEIDTALDIYGNRLTYLAYRENAQGPIFGTGQWRSSPQPAQGVVVNYYVDTRDANGQPQIIDAFYVEPTHLGVHCCLYYTRDLPQGNGEALDTSIPSLVVNGSPSVGSGGLTFSPTSSISIPALNLPQADWWVGINYQIGVIFGTTLLNCTPLAVEIVNSTIQIYNTLTGIPIFSIPFVQNLNSITTLYLGLLQPGSTSNLQAQPFIAGNLGVTNQIQVGPFGAIVLGVSGPTATQIIYFNLLSTLTWNSPVLVVGSQNFTLIDAVLKSETLTNENSANFLANPSSYADKGPFPGEDNTNNAYARFALRYISDTNPTGFVGGTPDVMGNLVWYPLQVFVMTKGYVTFEALQATFWKFEFTNLVAELYGNFIPINQTVNYVAPVGSSSYGYQGNVPPGYATQQAIGSGEVFTASTPNYTPAPSAQYVSPTQALIASNPLTAQTLTTQYPAQFSYINFYQGSQATITAAPGIENYSSVNMNSTSQISFFAGLSSLQAFRSNLSVQLDRQKISETFYDDLFFTSNIDLDPADLNTSTESNTFVSTPLETPGVTTSVIFESLHNVANIQFATVQTDPVQLVYDDQFQSSSYTTYNWLDNDVWHLVGDAQITWNQINNEVQVSRTETSTGLLGHGMVHAATSPVLAENIATSGLTIGGLESGVFLGSLAGRMFVAIRLTPLTTLTSPLLVQLMNANSETIIEEWVITGPPNQVIEEYFPYDIGSLSTNVPYRIRIVQEGISADAWIVSALSCFDEGIVWSFSNDGESWTNAIDIKNNLYGTLSFPTPNNQLAWKATIYRTNLHVNYLEIRPTYQNQKKLFPSYLLQGPNLSSTLSVAEDPLFNSWQLPIPQSWFSSALTKIALPDNVTLISALSHVFAILTTENFNASSDSAHTKVNFYNSFIEFSPTLDKLSGIMIYSKSVETMTTTDSVTATPVQSIVFASSSSAQTWTVPSNIFGPINFSVQAPSGSLASGMTSGAGLGSIVTGSYVATPGQVLTIWAGQSSGAGYHAGGIGGASGGGSSAILASGVTLLEAGAGGGSGTLNSQTGQTKSGLGNGGTPSGANGTNYTYGQDFSIGGTGATQSADGAGGQSYNVTNGAYYVGGGVIGSNGVGGEGGGVGSSSQGGGGGGGYKGGGGGGGQPFYPGQIGVAGYYVVLDTTPITYLDEGAGYGYPSNYSTGSYGSGAITSYYYENIQTVQGEPGVYSYMLLYSTTYYSYYPGTPAISSYPAYTNGGGGGGGASYASGNMMNPSYSLASNNVNGQVIIEYVVT